MRVARIALALLALALIVWFPVSRKTRPLRAQTDQTTAPTANGPASAQPQTAPSDPPGTIDGAKNPELIPDDVAYRLAFLGIAEPENATDEQKARARAKINAVGLSDDDADAFLFLLSQFHKQMASIDAEIAQIQVRSPIVHPLSTDAQKLLDLYKQRDQLFANTIAALPAKLSLEGVEQLQAYLQQAKRGMKMLPDTSSKMTPMN